MRSIRAEFKHSFFDFEDGLEGNYVKGLPKYSFGAHKSEYRGLAYDIDDTITGWPGTTIVPDRPFFTRFELLIQGFFVNTLIVLHQLSVRVPTSLGQHERLPAHVRLHQRGLELGPWQLYCHKR